MDPTQQPWPKRSPLVVFPFALRTTGSQVKPKDLDATTPAMERIQAGPRAHITWIRIGLSLICSRFTRYKFFQNRKVGKLFRGG